MSTFVGDSRFVNVPPHVIQALAKVERGRGHQQYLTSRAPDVMTSLARQAQIESVIGSNEIEGITVGRARAEAVLAQPEMARTDDELAYAGYRRALADIFDGHGPGAHPGASTGLATDDDVLTVPRLLHWHRQILGGVQPDSAGRFKTSDNRVIDRSIDGVAIDRFRTVPARATENAVVDLVGHTSDALRAGVHHPIFVAAGFALDLLVIHPFDDGNGRVARIATTALLYGCGYEVCRYVALEQLISERRTGYYESLRASTGGWHEFEHSVWPWVSYLLDILGIAYDRWDRMIGSTSNFDQRQIVRGWLRHDASNRFAISEAQRALVSVPPGTVRSVLDELRSAGVLRLEGAGRGTRWHIVDRSRI